jgi:glycosyltransferase involved in cell wall biosynthesis
MTDAPRLSICVPSRNRQDTFRQTILDLIASRRTDVEFVLADNSDDPTEMNDFLAGLADPRIRYLPAQPEALSMPDNWERTMAATSGDWIVFIGDDDYVDPDLAGVIADILRAAPDAEAIAWNKPSFKWPSYRPFAGNLSFSLVNDVRRANRSALVKRMLRWENASNVPSMPFTVYHGAVSRPVMERVRQLYGGRYFEHPTVDFDFGNKLLFAARSFIFVNRPLSIPGATEKSNASAVGRFAKALANYDTFIREEGGRFEQGPAWEDFPFRSNLGIAASIMSGQHWFKTTYNIAIDGWQENFVRALAFDCSRAIDRDEYDTQSELCRRAVARLENGRYLDAFTPYFVAGRTAMFTGLREDTLYVNEEIGGCQTPAELYHLLQSILAPLDALTFELGGDAAAEAA